MSGPGRNDPCPCGSGKKYKRCCLEREQEAHRVDRGREQGVLRAVEWLHERHGEAVSELLEAEFFGGLSQEERLRLRELPPGFARMLETNVNEWLLAEGTLELEGKRRRVADLVLGSGGLLLDADARLWLEAMAREPLALWEVQEVRPGVGLRVSSVLTKEPATRWVVERSASRQLDRWSLLGARLIPHGEDWLFSGAVYPFERDDLLEFRQAHAGLCHFHQELGHDRVAASWRAESGLLRSRWLARLLRRPVLPELRDASTGEPILFVTDHYRVCALDRLASLLAKQSDVDGNAEDGWTRFEEIAGDHRRSLLHVRMGRGDRLTVEARTLMAGNLGRAWFQNLVGESVEFVRRELSDPRSLAAAEAGSRRGATPTAIALTTEMMEAVYRSTYARWADEPVPSLGNKTPRKATRTAAGRQQVIELLKLYEEGEHRQAREQDREPVSLEFLWREVGLTRPE